MFDPRRVTWRLNHFITAREEMILQRTAESLGMGVAETFEMRQGLTDFPYVAYWKGFLTRTKGGDDLKYEYVLDYEQVMEAMQARIKQEVVDGS